MAAGTPRNPSAPPRGRLGIMIAIGPHRVPQREAVPALAKNADGMMRRGQASQKAVRRMGKRLGMLHPEALSPPPQQPNVTGPRTPPGRNRMGG